MSLHVASIIRCVVVVASVLFYWAECEFHADLEIIKVNEGKNHKFIDEPTVNWNANKVLGISIDTVDIVVVVVRRQQQSEV